MSVAVIWDLDGTLFDSYPVIVESVYLTFQESGIRLSREEIWDYAIRRSSSELFYEISDERSIAVEALFDRYRQISRAKYGEIVPMNGALAVLDGLQNLGVSQFVYTHRGKTTVPVLDKLGMTPYFERILTSESGFARKPDPEALHWLINTYGLDPEKTFYVGDRQLDMACAANAGIAGILFRQSPQIDVADGTESYVVDDLPQILRVVK